MTDKNNSEAEAWEMFLSVIFLSWNQDFHAPLERSFDTAVRGLGISVSSASN
jgi:hypothetical protein